jgi:hypothetical protein
VVGLAAFLHNPRMGQTYNRPISGDKNDIGAFVPFNSFDKEGTSPLQAALVYGVGFRYKLAQQWDIAFEMTWRNTTTDKIDGVYGNYHSPEDYGGNSNLTWAQQPEAYKMHNPTRAMFDEGSVKGKSGFMRNDAYLITGFHLTHILAGKVVCPKFR